eukprot:1320662-Amorphochlora_amoeboformis.AAC.2
MYSFFSGTQLLGHRNIMRIQSDIGTINALVLKTEIIVLLARWQELPVDIFRSQEGTTEPNRRLPSESGGDRTTPVFLGEIRVTVKDCEMLRDLAGMWIR